MCFILLILLQPSPLSFSLLCFHCLSLLFFIYRSISFSFFHSFSLSLSLSFYHSLSLSLSRYTSLYNSPCSLNSLPSSVHAHAHTRTCTHTHICVRTHHFQVLLCIVMLASGFLILVFLNNLSPCPPSPFPCLLSWLRH